MRKPILALAAVALILGLAPLSFSQSASKEAVAVTTPTAGSLKTTADIDLNDATPEEIRDYYSPLSGLPEDELSGENLLKNLKPILQNFTYYTYDNCWSIYEITDREWALSPANEVTIGTYDSSANVIRGYKHSKKLADATNGNNPYVHTLYRNRDPETGITIESARIREWGDHTQTGGTNREHVWCQSRGFKADDGASGPAGTDVHHLISGDGFVNGKPHNNNPYGYVDKTRLTSDQKTGVVNSTGDASLAYNYCLGNYSGAPINAHAQDESSTVFEPQDSDKGDIARACFYMAACYNNIAGETGVITQFNPNLTLCEYATSAGEREISSDTKAVGMGILSDLLAWHRLDPVDEYEIHRNNLIDKNYQHNRNPFIDFPEWVDYIWGVEEHDDETHELISYDPTPTGSVDLTKDVINGYREGGESSSSEQSTSEESSSEDTPEVLPVGGVSHCYKATNALTAGDTVSFIAPNLKYAMGETPNSGSAVEIVNDTVISNEPTAFSLGQNASGLFIQNSAGKYLTWSSGTSISWADALAAGSYWTILTYNDREMVVNVASLSTSTIRALTFRGGTYNYFRAYWVNNYTDEYDPVLPYRATSYVDEATEWSNRFLSTWTAGCRDNGYVAEEMDWAKAESVRDMMSETGQLILSQKKIDDSVLGQAVERYDRIVGKYGETTFKDFLLRKPSLTSGVKSIRLTSNGTIDALLFIALGIGAMACIATPLFLTRKKRKEQ